MFKKIEIFIICLLLSNFFVTLAHSDEDNTENNKVTNASEKKTSKAS